jgi:hypothetical protein
MKSREDHDSQDTTRQGEASWRPKHERWEGSDKADASRGRKVFIALLLPLLLLHISSKETRSIQIIAAQPQKRKKEEELGAEGKINRKRKRKRKPRHENSAYRSPTVSLFELRSGYSARQPKEESTREEEPKSLRSLMIR